MTRRHTWGGGVVNALCAGQVEIETSRCHLFKDHFMIFYRTEMISTKLLSMKGMPLPATSKWLECTYNRCVGA